MRKRRRTKNEKGLATLELVMGLPLIVFAMLFLIGLGYALMAKQRAEAGAQFAASYERARKHSPAEGVAGRAVAAGSEDFHLARKSGGVAGLTDSISYTASATPRRGLLARLFRLNAAKAQHHSVTGTGACSPGNLVTGCNPYRER